MSEQATLIINAKVTNHRVSSTKEEPLVKGIPEAGSHSFGIPGVIFAEGPTGRRARIAGTGLDVWEIIATWRSVGRNYERLQASYHWLTEAQLHAALEYYQHNPREVEERLKEEERWTPEVVWQEFPFARPVS